MMVVVMMRWMVPIRVPHLVDLWHLGNAADAAAAAAAAGRIRYSRRRRVLMADVTLAKPAAAGIVAVAAVVAQGLQLELAVRVRTAIVAARLPYHLPGPLPDHVIVVVPVRTAPRHRRMRTRLIVRVGIPRPSVAHPVLPSVRVVLVMRMLHSMVPAMVRGGRIILRPSALLLLLLLHLVVPVPATSNVWGALLLLLHLLLLLRRCRRLPLRVVGPSNQVRDLAVVLLVSVNLVLDAAFQLETLLAPDVQLLDE